MPWRTRWGTSLSVLLLHIGLCIVAPAAATNVLLADYDFDGGSLIPFSGLCPLPAYLTNPSAAGSTSAVRYVTSKSGFGQALAIPNAQSPYVGMLS